MSGARRGDGAARRLLGGRYRLGEVVRDGATGTVWRAEDEALGTAVEVRRLPPDPGLSEQEQAGLRRRRLTAGLHARDFFSPRVTPVVDVLEEDDAAYVVSEDVPGRRLADVLADGPLPEHEAALLGLGVLDALEPVHAAGLVHGDLRPGTVLLGPSGEVVLSGLGRSAEEPPAVGAPVDDVAAGSADAGDAGRSADLPALGRLLRDAVGGAPASPALAALLERLGSPDPGVRPDAGQIRHVFAELADDGADVGVGTDGGVDPRLDGDVPLRADRSRRRRRRALGAAAVLLVGAVAAAGVALVRSSTVAPEVIAAAGTAAASGLGQDAGTPDSAQPGSSTGPGGAPAGANGAQRPAPAGPLELSEAAPAPAGWSTYQDPDGAFTVAYPPRWQLRDQTAGARFVSGTGLSSLFVGIRSGIGSASEQQVSEAERAFAAGKQDYRRLRLTPTSFRGVPAYEWEATFVERGVAQHASALGFVVDGRGYLLYLQSTERTWNRLADVERHVRASFRVAA